MKACNLGLLILLLHFAPPTESVVHRIQSRQYSLHPRSLSVIKRQNLLKNLLSIEKRNINPRHNAALRSGSVWAKASAETQSENQYGYYALGANISIGSPPQTMFVEFDMFMSTDLSVISSNANLSSVSAELPPKHTFNSNDSSTYNDLDYVFSKDDSTGTLGSDFLQLGELKTKLSFGVIEDLGSWYRYQQFDGTLGLATHRSTNGISNVLTQIAAHLDQPIVSLWSNKTQESNQGVTQITLGAEDVANCENNFAYVPQVSFQLPGESQQINGFNLHSVTANVSEDNFINQTVQSTIYLVDFYVDIFAPTAVFNIFLEASGAVFNSTSYEYEVDCENVASLPNVTFYIGANGSKELVLSPAQYIDFNPLYNSCYLYVADAGLYYDDYPYILLGQQFLNKYCLAYNIKEKWVGFADSIPLLPSEIATTTIEPSTIEITITLTESTTTETTTDSTTTLETTTESTTTSTESTTESSTSTTSVEPTSTSVETTTMSSTITETLSTSTGTEATTVPSTESTPITSESTTTEPTPQPTSTSTESTTTESTTSESTGVTTESSTVESTTSSSVITTLSTSTSTETTTAEATTTETPLTSTKSTTTEPVTTSSTTVEQSTSTTTESTTTEPSTLSTSVSSTAESTTTEVTTSTPENLTSTTEATTTSSAITIETSTATTENSTTTEEPISTSTEEPIVTVGNVPWTTMKTTTRSPTQRITDPPLEI